MIGAMLRTFLLGDETIVAMVGARIYPLRLPQKPVMPGIVIQRVSGVRYDHLRGGTGALARPRYQIDSWSQTHDGAVQLGKRVRLRLSGYIGTWTYADVSPPLATTVKVLMQDERDDFEQDILGGLCRHSADYYIFYSTAEGQL